MRPRWPALLVSAALFLAAAAYVVLFATTPADCGRVGPSVGSWTAEGVVVDAVGDCPLRDGELVSGVEDTGPGTVDLTVQRDGDESRVPVALTRPSVAGPLLPAWPTLLFVGGLAGTAAYVWWRRPGPATGGLLVFGAGLGTSTVAVLLGLPTTGAYDTVPRALYLLLTQVGYLVGWCGALAFVLFFPRPYERLGRLPRGAVWWLAASPLVAATVLAAVAAVGSPDGFAWVGRVVGGNAVVVIVALVAIGWLMVARLRGARDAVERQQLRWLAGTGVLAVVSALVGWFLPEVLLGRGLPTAWIGIGGLPFVAGLAIAVTRYRLFDLDVVLNRALVYGLLTAAAVSVYLVVVTATSALLRGDSLTAASVAATVAVALTLNPMRVVLQRTVRRLLYGDRDEPYVALTRLARRLEVAGDEEALSAIATDLASALRAPYVAVDVPGLGRSVTAGARPRWLPAGDGDGALVAVPLVDHGEAIGTLRLAPRAPGAAYGGADRRLLDDLARQVAAAVRELTLRADLQRSRERIVVAREEERRRLRRALHDDLGPAIAGLGMHSEVARRLLPRDPGRADQLLDEVRAGMQRLVGDVRRLAYDLRPPALDELGLVGALRQEERSAAPRVVVTSGDLGPLPAAVETAAYRIAVEAVRNTERHAAAATCDVRLAVTGGCLEVSVVDDGVGLADGAPQGVGRTAMRERAEELGGTLLVRSLPTGGTAVVARLPLDGRQP